MAVELRCPEPDCRAKLRLPEYPDPGTEVECPKCGVVFAAPDLETGEEPDPRARRRPADDEDDDRPRKKRKPAAEGEDGPKPKPAPPKEAKKDGDKKPKKRKAKKQETNRTLLVGMSIAGLAFLVVMTVLLVWFFGRKPVSYEMIGYLPDDSNTAYGLNIGHMQKYPEFLKKVEPTYQNTGFKRATDVLATALGIPSSDLVDTIVGGSGKNGGALVIRTKKPFDRAGLAKLPGAKEYPVDGLTYYTVADVTNLGFAGPRVFAPTDRLVVFCTGGIPDATFRKMLVGNRDNFDTTMVGRAPALAKRTVRGTFWSMDLYEGGAPRPVAPPKKDGAGPGGEFKTEAAALTASAKGFGFKASLGSRAVKFETIILYPDSEAPTNLYQKYKDSDLAKGDEAEPPRWWKDLTGQLQSKKVAQELLSTLGAKASGELFYYYAEVNTLVIMDVIGSLASKVAQQQGQPTQ